MADRVDLAALNLSGIAHRCAQETTHFFNRKDYDPAFCYELFRRAILHHDEHAHSCLYSQYQPLVAGWVERHPSYPGTGEEIQYFVNRSFEKIWRAVTPEKFERFPNLPSLLRYLKLCTNSVIVDHSRLRRHETVDAEPEEALAGKPRPGPSVEDSAVYESQKKSFWHLFEQRMASEKERLVLHGCFVLAMKPRELQQSYSQVFDDTREIYRIKQNVLARLRRDKELRDILLDYAETFG
ncbi:MAG: hypothetical protein U9R25_01055 [Chloroflexota bacterium]|nr:hypothetical protein [Chloroflexota bacterium]